MKKLYLSITAAALVILSCKNDKTPETISNEVNKTVKEEASKKPKTILTEENFGLAESQMIFAKYVKDIAAITKTNGVGVFMHKKKAPDPKDKTVVRINFDTQYSVAILDLKEEATLTMPETNGRYQTAWFVTEEHYNPMAINNPGTYKINQENMGSRYVMLVIRTQVNMTDPEDLAKVSALQDQLKLTQNDRGSYVITNNWDRPEVLKMREKYQKIVREKNITSSMMFGKKGEVTLENHNVGVSTGWGGMTSKQAVYPNFQPKNSNPATLTLKDVPVDAFWSITVYDQGGWINGEKFNINSSFAKVNDNGEYIIHFGGDKSADNYLDTFEGWNFILRMYQPTEEYFDGSWKVPELIQQKN
ncbi:MAG: DUF1254 domain-containing protein [Winogradskyella sp.]|uniref:DUF1254 domain-containing protein n=1 Tax=Winogradskyella sp. TaxID=1883156 RepID=UPI0025D5819E|nr:DUF1254 domain-containing protein [Winogradskyella sp.]NRB83503.1 DUF1254 domain-containing protein [Winogradskyella sp.]